MTATIGSIDTGAATPLRAGVMPPQAAAGPSGTSFDIGRVLDEAHWSSFQKRVLVLVSLVIVLDGLDTQTLTLAIPSIIREWGISRAPFGPVLALGFLAMALGTALGGLFGDRFGRKGALLVSTLIFGAGTLLGALSNDVLMLGATRILASVGLGAAMPNATAMVAEYTPRRQRSLALGIALGSVPVGAFVGGMLAAVILPLGSWRPLFVVCGLIPFAGALALAAFLPESMRFLLGRAGAGPRIAALLGRIGHPVESGTTFIDTLETRPTRTSLREIFAPVHRRDTLTLASAFFLIICANLFLVSWTPSLLADLGYPAKITSTGAAIFSIGGLFGAIGGAALFGRIGSRHALSVMIAGAIATCLAIVLTPDGPHGIGAAGLLTLLFIAGTFIAGTQVLLFSLAGQAYPTAIRATGVGFAAAVGRIGAVLSGLAGPLLLRGGPPSAFAAVAVAMLASGLLLLCTRTVIAPHRRAAG